jgi:hypothetical protein
MNEMQKSRVFGVGGIQFSPFGTLPIAIRKIVGITSMLRGDGVCIAVKTHDLEAATRLTPGLRGILTMDVNSSQLPGAPPMISLNDINLGELRVQRLPLISSNYAGFFIEATIYFDDELE